MSKVLIYRRCLWTNLVIVRGIACCWRRGSFRVGLFFVEFVGGSYRLKSKRKIGDN
jgi:hypothetical protein